MIDCGTSILIANPARLDFTAETVIGTLAQIFEREGLPQQLTFDRDPRFVGGAERGRDFPSPLVRFLNVLGVEPDICPPRQPFKNPFAERVNRTYKYEGILVYLPEDLTQTEDMNHDFRRHYNYQRPHQGVSCGNQPPRVAFPDLPTLPALPDTVDPDSWLTHYDGLTFLRRVNPNGSVVVDRRYYYVGQALKGEQVALQLVAQQQGLKVLHNQQTIKTLPLKGLVGHPLPWADYLTLIQQEARSDWQAYLRRHRRYLPLLP